MISDSKKEEVRDASDIVEVVSDYVKLKRSGSGFTGLCPYHNEKTPSFHVSPDRGIYKCFGCGESGDVFKFVMDQEGVGFTEAIKQLADRYGVFIPEEETTPEQDAHVQLKEGIYHALRYAGVFFYRNLIENPEAEKAMAYLQKRGYNREIIKRFGLGYSPASGSDLWRSATNAGISEEYLLEADLIKRSNRGDGFYDTFRGRLMFPIFSRTNQVIAFAGRVLGNEKTAKYINSAQTKVYNKSEVVFGLNYAKNEIRKQKEVILVEGYTDVITLNEHEVKNVVASSGTALTSGQINLLSRYGEKIVMIYDSDSAGQNAMKRGIDIALAGGMEVQLLELPTGEDPDSFVKQFGKESFDEIKTKESKDFVDFLMLKAEEEGRLEQPMQQAKVIREILGTIASIPDSLQRQVYVQHLHQRTQRFRKGTDRELFEDLERILAEKQREKERSQRREERRNQPIQHDPNEPPPFSDSDFIMTDEEGFVSDDFGGMPVENPGLPPSSVGRLSSSARKKPHYEKELIRLMISYGRDMVEYICSLTNSRLFEDDELRMFYDDIVEQYKNDGDISIKHYTAQDDPFPRLTGDVLLEQHSASERHHEKIGVKFQKDKNPYRTSKSSIKALELSFFKRKREELAEKFKTAEDDEKREIIQIQADIQAKITHREKTDSDDLYPDPDGTAENVVNDKVFEYKMKSDR